MRRLFLFIVCLLCFSSFASADEDFHVIPLHYRSADEMAPILKSMFAGRARFSQLDTRLVVACEGEIYQQILALLANLDHKPHQLLISAKVARREEMNQTKIGIAATVDRKQQNVAMQTQQMQIAGTDSGVRSVTVVEGFKASFRSAELFPAISFSSQQGFTVLAQLAQGHAVNIELESHDDKNLHTTGIATSLHGELDKWIPAGAVNQSQSGATAVDAKMLLWLKVSLAD